MTNKKDAFDLWWAWAQKPPHSPADYSRRDPDAVMALPPDERRDPAKVNEAVRERLRLGRAAPCGQ